MIKLPKLRNCIVIKNYGELNKAKDVPCCSHIIKEDGNNIHMWNCVKGKWTYIKYVAFGEDKKSDVDTTGLKAYQAYYKYCGKEEVDRMKTIIPPIELWESEEQEHFCNWEYANQKIYKSIYVFDANSAFTYGVFRLPDGFEPLKQYMSELYEKKANAPNKTIRSRYKNLQVYLIGYFARIKGYVSTRSEVIKASNKNINSKMLEIISAGGTVYLSNTDSIVTDERGAEIMYKYVGNDAGQFKIEQNATRLCYLSPNCYQIDDKVKYGGVKYFARINVDLFQDYSATQKGSLIEPFDFSIEDDGVVKLCKVRGGTIIVDVKSRLGELITTKTYILEVEQ